jgi:hypothetical protein
MGSFGVVVIGMWRVVFFEIVHCSHFSFPPLYQKKFVDRVFMNTSLFVCNDLNCYAKSQCSNVFFDLKGSGIENAVDFL